jgi:hypothetical protein
MIWSLAILSNEINERSNEDYKASFPQFLMHYFIIFPSTILFEISMASVT